MKFRPCIDLHEGKVKQIVGRTLSDAGQGSLVTNFETGRSPADFARAFRADGLRGGHVIMLGKGNEAAAGEALRAFPDGFQIGGGITPGNANAFLNMGASHVIVTSYVFGEGRVDWDRLSEISAAVGKGRLVLDLSCTRRGSDYFVVAHRWQTTTTVSLTRDRLQRLARQCDEFLVHAADFEGAMGGVDTELVALLAEFSPIKTTYAGGIRSVADLEAVKEHGAGRVDATVGSALDIYGGSLKYADVVAWQARQPGT
jgi:phosphoribosylformimino-5-aminoimidazole carboxamide ribotide isomerase